MVCKKCETENSDDAVFCKHCGRRLDGTLVCPACGAQCPEDALFCSACGAPVTAQSIPTKPQKKTGSPERGGVFEKVKYAFDLSGSICAIVAVFFALLFTFFIGFTAYATEDGVTQALGTTTLWDFFGTVYKNLGEIFEEAGDSSAYYRAAYYLPAVLETVISAATLITVITFAIFAAVKFATHFKNPDNGYEKYAAATVFSYLTGVLLSFGLTATSSNSTDTKLNGATVAGIVLSCIFLGLYFACKTVTLGKAIMQKKTIIALVCALAGILFTVLTVAFAAQSVVDITIIQSGYYTSKITSHTDLLTLNAMLAEILENQTANIEFTFAYIMNIFAQCVQFSVIIIGGVLLVKRVVEFDEKSPLSFKLSITLAALALASLVFTCVGIQLTVNSFKEFADSFVKYKFYIAAGPIVALITAIFNLADAITHKILSKTSDTEIPENTQLPDNIE